ncbi:hypothetical protein NE237_029386 [Protea cynaroides]|uniref:Uncharacterized protein n=1 Tax=Protea cynaroides TaxID=273540 RepID=A0A9Q0GVP5_9MAGN|nr:hypothetical protein NE237_029386 [Protea cynaroides]
MTATMEEEEESHELLAMEMVSASVVPMVLRAALELHIFDIIADAGAGACLSSLDIASRLPTQNPDAPRLLDCMLRLLVSHSLLTCNTVFSHDHRLYGLAPASKLFLKNKDGVSLASFFMHRIQDYAIIKSWYHLKDSILEGGDAFSKAHGIGLLGYLGKESKVRENFRSTLSEFNVLLMNKVLDTYNGFEGLQVLVDVGGWTGDILNMIISKYPSIKGINFDLPHVIQGAIPYSGVEHVGGDMFISIPKGDAIFMKSVMHAWSDEQCRVLLKNCYEALPNYGKVIVIELVAPTSFETNVATRGILQMEMYMTNLNATGKERSEEEFSVLAREAGFSRTCVACCAYTFSIIEFHK